MKSVDFVQSFSDVMLRFAGDDMILKAISTNTGITAVLRSIGTARQKQDLLSQQLQVLALITKKANYEENAKNDSVKEEVRDQLIMCGFEELANSNFVKDATSCITILHNVASKFEAFNAEVKELETLVPIIEKYGEKEEFTLCFTNWYGTMAQMNDNIANFKKSGVLPALKQAIGKCQKDAAVAAASARFSDVLK